VFYITGVGGGIGPLVDTATSDCPMLVIDGCPLEYARKSLEQHAGLPDRHVNFAERSVPNSYHTDCDDELAGDLYDDLVRIDVVDSIALDVERLSLRDRW